MNFYGIEMGRIGSNINQLSKHAKRLNKENKLDNNIMEDLTESLEEYNNLKSKILMSFNKILSDA